MDWKDVASTVAKVAPLLAGVLGGPVGAVAGAAGSLVASWLGEEAEPGAVARALTDPETALRLRELESRERERLLAWRETQLAAELRNVEGAREREVRLAGMGHGAAWATALVALVVSLGFFGVLALVLRGAEVGEAALLLLGSLGTAFGAVVNYYLGSSMGSRQKDALVARGGV